MENRIAEVRHEVRALSPAQAEIWFTVVAEHISHATEVRGIVVGPRCPGRTTIEVAYPFQPIPHPPATAPPLTMRVVIPDPSLWEQAAPFSYRAVVELWQDGQRCEEQAFDLGLRMRN
jgi:hypothetical protein